MKNTNIDIRLEGSKFSPKKLKAITNLPVEILAEKGEIAKKGRYKGKPSPYGIALIPVNESSKENLSTVMSRYTQMLLKDGKKALKESGVEEIVVDIETSPHSIAGFSFEEKLIHEISELNARIVFQTVEDNTTLPDRFSHSAKVAEPPTVYKKKSNPDKRDL